MYAIDVEDYQEAERAFRDFAVFYPWDSTGYAYLALPERKMGNMAQAIKGLQMVERLEGGRPFARQQLAAFYTIEGNFKEARNWIGQLRQSGYLDLATFLESNILFLEHRYQEAENGYDQLLDSKDVPLSSSSYARLARVLVVRGQQTKAIEVLTAGIQQDDSLGSKPQLAEKLLDRAVLQCRAKRVRLCLNDFRRALPLLQGPRNLMIAADRIGASLAESGGLDSGEFTGMLDDLERRLPQGEFEPITSLARLRIQGELRLAENNPEAALELFRRAAVKEAPANSRMYLVRALLAVAAHNHRSTLAVGPLREISSVLDAEIANTGMIWHDCIDYRPDWLDYQLGVLRIVSRSTRQLGNT